jgi:hypothetical protein
MAFTDEDRRIIEVRELLYKQRNKDAVVNYYVNRGMDPDEAREMVFSIYKENLWENRKMALGTMIGGGIGTTIFVGIYLSSGRLFYIWLPLCAIAFLVGVAKFIMASGYEMNVEED